MELWIFSFYEILGLGYESLHSYRILGWMVGGPRISTNRGMGSWIPTFLLILQMVAVDPHISTKSWGAGYGTPVPNPGVEGFESPLLRNPRVRDVSSLDNT